MTVTNALWTRGREAKTKCTTIAFEAVRIALTLRDCRLTLPVAAAEKWNARLTTLSVIVAYERSYTATGDAVAFVGTIVPIGAGTVCTHTGLVLTNLRRVRTIGVSGAKIFPDLTSPVKASLRVGALVVSNTIRVYAEGISAH